MEPDSITHGSKRFVRIRPAMRVNAALAAALLFLVITSAPAFGEQDTVLEQSGIRYPEGFDVNTVGEIHGKASGLHLPDKGPIRFTLSSKRETYTVFASPKWYWEDLNIPALDGMEVRVVGSKTLGKDGNLYVVAQELTIVSSGLSHSLRAIDGRPLWKGPRLGSGASRRTGEQPFRGGGGGMGHGRR